MVEVPLMEAVGRGFMEIIALPVMFGCGADTVHVVPTFVTLTIV
jgi:hypothetical protein